jgi:predicted HTH transcriptional regulator
MDFEAATKQQLLQIAMNEKCSLNDKYQALRELQQRDKRNKYNMKMTEEKKALIIYHWTKGLTVKELRNQFDISKRDIEEMIDKHKLWRGRLLG